MIDSVPLPALELFVIDPMFNVPSLPIVTVSALKKPPISASPLTLSVYDPEVVPIPNVPNCKSSDVLISEDPSKLTPPMVTADANFVDVAAFPSILPEIVEENVFVPEMV